MKRFALISLSFALAACPGDKDAAVPIDTVARDTTPVNLDSIRTDIPAAAPDTFTPPKLPTTTASAPAIPQAPAPLVAVAEREQASSNFCYQEFGLKSDPSLRGGVAMIVTVSSSGVTGARVGADSWTSRSGKAVNQCLNERLTEAWKLAPGEVKAGRYVVQLRFSGAT